MVNDIMFGLVKFGMFEYDGFFYYDGGGIVD